jgi:hypothetical protein
VRSPSTSAGTTPQPSATVSDGPGPEIPPGKRVYAKTRYVWIRGAPDSSLQWIGYLWHGGSVALKSETPIAANGCATWYAIEPRGYVCVDGKRATLDPSDPEFVQIARYSPDPTGPWPHPSYAESLGGERYGALPTREEQKQRERNLDDRLARIAAARRGEPLADLFAGIDFSPGGDDPVTFASLPAGLQIQRRYLKPESTLAYTRAVEHAERTFLLTADLTWIPKDRVRPYPKVEFSGVHLDGDVQLPLAFFRYEDRPRYSRTTDGGFEPSGKTFTRLSWIALTGNSATVEDEEYLETAEGTWVKARDAAIPNPGTKTPWGAEVGKPDTTEHRPDGRGTWIEASVYGGWLVAFEGTRAVFATLISPGRGGVPVPGKDPVSTASTPTGRFSITGKFVTATMESPTELIHSDVPWTQNFSGPHALHSAYWHNDFGKPKSGGCVNVSPIDGKWLYGFTEPEVPKDWHAVRWNPRAEASTLLIIHK